MLSDSDGSMEYFNVVVFYVSDLGHKKEVLGRSSVSTLYSAPTVRKFDASGEGEGAVQVSHCLPKRWSRTAKKPVMFSDKSLTSLANIHISIRPILGKRYSYFLLYLKPSRDNSV